MLAERLPGNVELLDASALARHSGASYSSSTLHGEGLFERELAARLKRVRDSSPLTLIVDNSEFLLLQIENDGLRSVVEELKQVRLKLILIRNRLVLEREGLLCRRESPLAALLPRAELRPFKEDEGLEVARRFLRDSEAFNERHAKWLLDWSGGLPGLMFELKPLMSRTPTPVSCPERLTKRIEHVAGEWTNAGSIRRQVVAHARANLLAPLGLLEYPIAMEVGSLCAEGILDPDYALGGSPFIGRFWSSVATQTPSVTRSPRSGCSEAAKRLVALLEHSHLSDSVADALDGRSKQVLEMLLQRAFVADNDSSLPSISLDQFLAETLGRVGLRRVLEVGGVRSNAGDDPLELGRRLIRLAWSS